jgi:hypothetical protein
MTPQRQKAYDDAYEKEAAEKKKRLAQEEAEQQQRRAKAMDAATRLMTTSFANLPMMILQNVMSGRSALLGLSKDDKVGAGQKAAGLGMAALALTFQKVLGVLGQLVNIVSVGTSGISLFTKAAQLFATAVAPILLPILFAWTVAIAAASDVIFAELMPVLEELTDVFLAYAIPAVVGLVDVIRWAAGKIREALQWVANGGLGSGAANMAGKLHQWVGNNTSDRSKGAVKSAMADTLTELRLMSQTTPVSSGGSAAAWSKAQSAVLNQSPFERRMQEMMTKVVDMMSRSANKAGGNEHSMFKESNKAGGAK